MFEQLLHVHRVYSLLLSPHLELDVVVLHMVRQGLGCVRYATFLTLLSIRGSYVHQTELLQFPDLSHLAWHSWDRS